MTESVLPAEDSFHTLYDDAPCGYLSTAPDGTIVSVNETVARWLGYPVTEIVGRPLRGLLDTGSQLFYETRYLPVLRLNGEVRGVALTMRRSDGSDLPVLVNATLVLDEDGRPRLVRTALFDSTSRRDYERELLAARRAAESSEFRVRILQDASMAFDSATTEAELAEALVDVARQAFSASDAAVHFIDHDGSLELAAGTHRLAYPFADSQTRPETDALTTANVVTLASLEEATLRYPATATAMATARVAALVVVPLLAEGEIEGVLVCFFGRDRDFDEHVLALQHALARLAMQVLARIRLQVALEHLGLHDQLTGLANRRLLYERLSITLDAAHRDDTPVAMIFLDLDGFKRINDELGHSMGDTVLRMVSERLLRVVRQHDIVARFGGDEFAIICAGSGWDAASIIAERIRETVSEPMNELVESHSVAASIGVAVYLPRSGFSADNADLLAAADAAMYESKRAGKDRVTVIEV